MKKITALLGIVLVSAIASTSHGALWDRGGGLIYDDVLDITWLQDANYALTSDYDSDGLMTWEEAETWAGQLVYGGYDDWYLPKGNGAIFVFT